MQRKYSLPILILTGALKLAALTSCTGERIAEEARRLVAEADTIPVHIEPGAVAEQGLANIYRAMWLEEVQAMPHENGDVKAATWQFYGPAMDSLRGDSPVPKYKLNLSGNGR